ncbi:hypothetical protein ALNOE001_21620 [Candidatus Methanobinarius endosymbioticus]|uniref:Uncharacterized protein n=1 Tax=Candidatus Methanobinarius endosymbioticus TaxID=2006182 RepID=A0A366M8A7_9EURY|nr:hypothetical protein ALNOE001_21620 [Candidatus Methanobinarius endosymbioticus]
MIGANLPDFDHDIKKINLYKMMIVGLLVFIILFIVNLYLIKVPYIIGVILCIFPLIFYFSNHRGFTHSLLGMVVLSILISFVMVMGMNVVIQILNSLNLSDLFTSLIFSSQIIAMVVIVIFFALLIINKKIILPFIILFVLEIIFFPNGLNIINFMGNEFIIGNNINFNQFLLIDHNFLHGYDLNQLGIIEIFQILKYIFFPVFLGLLSHILLDSLTPAGIQLFRPFSSKKVYKKFAIFVLFILSFLAILKYFPLFLTF